MLNPPNFLSILLCAFALAMPAWAGAIRTIPGFTPTSLPKGDDVSSAVVPLGFTINFLGRTNSTVYVNTNGNITFGAPFVGYPGMPAEDQAGGVVPPISSSPLQLISGFLADVDATPPAVGTITYGTTTINGRTAFVATYTNVTYFSFDSVGFDTKRNSFQIVLLDRSDTGAGNFDIELNYDKVEWETADSNGGTNGLGGYSAQVGYTNGTQAPGSFLELTGSEIPGSFINGGPLSLVAGSLNSGGVAGRYIFAIRNTVPTAVVSALSPSSALAGGTAFTLTVNGTGFAANSSVLWNGSPLPTTFVNASLLTASVAANLIASPGSATVTVRTNNVTSNGVSFNITTAAPTLSITGMNPLAAQAGGPAFTLTVNGTGFSANSIVLWNGAGIPTTFWSSSQLTAAVGANMIAAQGSVTVTVSSGGATSNGVPFNISAAAPNLSVSGISPSSTTAGGQGFTLTVFGTGFASNSTILWNGSALPTTFTNISQLTATVAANLIASAGTAAVSVNSNGAPSNGVTFTINSAGPSLAVTGISPSAAQAGGPAFTLTVYGSGFAPNATILWNGSALPTTFGSSSQLTANVAANLIASQGTASVTVSSNAATSNGRTFSITAPAPTLAVTSISPSAAQAGGAGFTLTVNGAAFAGNAAVLWNGTALPTTFVTSSVLNATVAGSLIANKGAATVTVSSGGATSNAVTFTISAPTATATISSLNPAAAQAGGATFTLTVNGFGFTEASAVLWNGTPLLTTFVSGAQLKVSVDSTLIATKGTAAVAVSTGGTATSAAAFTITDPPPTPTVTSISPASVATGSQSFTLTVTGNGFIPASGSQAGSTILWNGAPIPTTYVSDTLLTAIIDAAFIGPQRTVTVSVTSATNSLPFTVQGISGQQLSVYPPELNLTARTGGPAPTPTTLSVWSKGSAVKFHVAGSTVSWLDYSSNAGQTNQGISISARTTGMTAGGYRGELLIQNDALTGEQQKIPVSLTLLPATDPQLEVAPLNPVIEMTRDSAPAQYRLVVTNSGAGKLMFVAQAFGGDWIALQNTYGSATTTSPSSLTYTLDPGGLAKGIYNGAIVLTDINSNQRLTVQVTLVVSERSKPVTVSQRALQFTLTGSQPVARKSFSIRNEGGSPVGFSVVSDTSSGGGWLTIPSQTSGTLPPGAATKLTVTVNPQGLTPDRYFGIIRVKAGADGESVQSIPVLLTVQDSSLAKGPRLGQAGITIVGTSGGTGVTKVELSNPTGIPIDFSSVPGADWLTIRPASGSIAPYQSFSVAVTADSTRSGAGTRSAIVRFPFSDGAIGSLNVVSITRFAGCTPTGLTVQITSLEQGFTVEAGGVATIQARVVDSCGNPRSTGALVAHISNELTPVVMSNDDEGLWSGSLQAGRTLGNVQVTVAAASDQGASTLTGQATVSGSVAPSAGLGPVVDRATNSAGYQAGGQISPGAWVSIFGDQFADSQIIAPSGQPYPTELGGTRVTLGGARLPLLFVDPRQVNVFVPFTVTPDTVQELMIERRGSYSTPLDLKIAEAVPGIYTINQSGSGQGGIVFSGTRTLVAPAPAGRPARPGDSIEIYATGLGLVQNPPEDGQTASTTKLSPTVDPVTVTIGDVPTAPQFAGLTPGFVGLFQINVQVPDGVPSGAAVPLSISIRRKESNTVTIAIQ